MEYTPVIFEHAASFIGKRPWEVSRDADLLFEAHAAAYRVYGHAPIVVGIDVYNVEAEAYGARVEDPGGYEVPTVARTLCGSPAEIVQLKSYDAAATGRFPLILQAARRLRGEFPRAEIRIPLSGPFSIACGLVGFQDLLMAMMEDPDIVVEALMRLAEDQVRLCRRIADEGFRAIIFESSASPPLVSPALFERVVFPSLRFLVGESSPLTGEPPPLILGGDTARILPLLVATGTSYLICPAETNTRQFMDEAARHPSLSVRINVRPGLFAPGPEAPLLEALQAAVAAAGERPRTSVGTGVLPYDAVPGRVLKGKSLVEGA